MACILGCMDELIRLRLVELVGHLVEADTDQAEVIHPYALGNGEPAERQLAFAADEAAKAMLTPGQREWAEHLGLRLVPVAAHRGEIQMVGIARLRYRPRTSATAAWYARMPEWEQMTTRFYQLAAEARGTGMHGLQHQGARQHQGASR